MASLKMRQKSFCAKVHVRLKPGVLDPQGQTVKQALETLGYRGIQEVRMGKLIEIRLNGKDRRQLEKEVKEMSRKVLINPLIEEFYYEIESE